ncbi:MAG: PBP1A family penicillin-binding protein [Zoogloeaceae bacterium]|jgi:penicillin-binding protein 1A|nr:PBP1A family penicillin-binding protein [Zoogloeaceae bacterium]
MLSSLRARLAGMLLYPLIVALGLALIGASLAAIAFIRVYPQLPSLEALTNYQPHIPLRVYSSDGYLIGEFGEERRTPIKIKDVPDVMKKALLAAEDDDFYQHHGVDFKGILRTFYVNLVSRSKRQGASTITMQVARNFFLTPEKSLTRKFYEVLLSFKIEQNLSKDQIFELYINHIFLGQHSYGFEAASKVYFGKPLAEINLAEAAMLAGLPKSPGVLNPISSPKGARQRQAYVLRRMHELKFITAAQRQEAMDAQLVLRRETLSTHAEFVAEMARLIALDAFPNHVYSGGLKVITTIRRDEQEAAWRALREGVLAYDRRQGYRGAEGFIDLARLAEETKRNKPDGTEDFSGALEHALYEYPQAENLFPAVVLESAKQQVKARVLGGEELLLSGSAIKFAEKMLGDRAPAGKRLRPGAVIRVSLMEKESKNKNRASDEEAEKEWQIAQLPEVESAFAAVSPESGEVRALVGGFDFNRNKYNHVTQAWRQPGSSFKPFIYSAALERGFSPGSIVPDEPIVIPAEVTGGQEWRPKNYDGTFDGPMKLRAALAKSKNMVSIYLLQNIGAEYAQDYVTRFGFEARRHPPYLTMALGAGSVTPWQMVAAYSVFANGGYRVRPYIVKEIRDQQDRVLARTASESAGNEKLRVIDPRNAYLMTSMLHDVTIFGTAARASSALKRRDLAGKTGTTNDYLDAWFCGFQKSVTGCAWLGFDQPRKLGSRETGGYAALPIWISFMRTALADVPEKMDGPPSGVVSGDQSDLYYAENLPPPVLNDLPELDLGNIYAPRPQQGNPAPFPAQSPPLKPFSPLNVSEPPTD